MSAQRASSGSRILREGVLEGREVVVDGGASRVLRERLATLGAELVEETSPGSRALVHDARLSFGAAGGRETLMRAMAEAWSAVRAAAEGSMIPGEPSGSGGRIILIAPREGEFAGAAAAGLENLARTLSIEWARFGITTVCVTPGPVSGEPELAEVVAYLLSEAGGYFSGCRLALG